jgi:hypothetical protein
MNGTAHLPDWRDKAAYDVIPALGRDALAWEVLRRDPAYRRFAAASALAAETSAVAPGAADAWGLHFP